MWEQHSRARRAGAQSARGGRAATAAHQDLAVRGVHRDLADLNVGDDVRSYWSHNEAHSELIAFSQRLWPPPILIVHYEHICYE